MDTIKSVGQKRVRKGLLETLDLNAVRNFGTSSAAEERVVHRGWGKGGRGRGLPGQSVGSEEAFPLRLSASKSSELGQTREALLRRGNDLLLSECAGSRASCRQAAADVSAGCRGDDKHLLHTVAGKPRGNNEL